MWQSSTKESQPAHSARGGCEIRGSLDFFCMGTFIDSTHMKL